MNAYEFVFITKDGSKTVLEGTEKLISGFKGNVSKRDDWGKKQFAYKMAGLKEGHYHVWNLDMNTSDMFEFKNKLNLEKGIIRYLILKKD